MTDQRESGAGARGLTLLITNVTKVAGVFLAIRTAIETPNNAIAFATAALMMAGGQLSESTVIYFIDKLFGNEKEK